MFIQNLVYHKFGGLSINNSPKSTQYRSFFRALTAPGCCRFLACLPLLDLDQRSCRAAIDLVSYCCERCPPSEFASSNLLGRTETGRKSSTAKQVIEAVRIALPEKTDDRDASENCTVKDSKGIFPRLVARIRESNAAERVCFAFGLVTAITSCRKPFPKNTHLRDIWLMLGEKAGNRTSAIVYN